ncbi:hypothetical protein Hsw_1526 [Hymenobacter swuensis DY53]|uniref:Uncharacterized protein n=1 Tax=Hymenobacter swuensis DY53 TaxID=1227739 RepID=W8F3F2_9BACT|nr:hypothetical protein Hsw_1526 [Hymenobacter swuensis DY53]
MFIGFQEKLKGGTGKRCKLRNGAGFVSEFLLNDYFSQKTVVWDGQA